MLIDLIKPRKIVDNIPFVYDSTRTKWVSEQEFFTIFRIIRTGFISGDRFIFYEDKPSNVMGHKFDRDSVIKQIIIFTENAATFDVYIYRNKSNLIKTINMNSENEKIVTMNDDFDQLDDLSCKFISSEYLKNINISFLYSYCI